LQQCGDVVAADLYAGRLLNGEGAGLVGRLLKHGGKTEKLAVAGFVDHNLLLVFVDRTYLDDAGQHNVSVHAWIANLIDALPGSKHLKVDLGSQDRYFIIVKQGKERDMFELDWVARHGSPQRR
jgi:hypothetical protein